MEKNANVPEGDSARNGRRWFHQAGKRLFDLVFAASGLVLLSPLGLLIGLWIKLSAPGPVFYGQVRLGRLGRPFRIWKFRSMVAAADKMGPPLTRGEDPRVTRVGRCLRQTKLDELPQLWNVLLGEMSFVGPRPEVARYVERYTPRQREVLKCTPGITDVASLLFRNEEALLRGAADVEQFYVRYCLPKKIALNLEYAAQASVGRDIWLILQTLWLAVLGGLGGGWRRLRQRGAGSLAQTPEPVCRVAIIGTDAAALQVARDLSPTGADARRVVAFFDDNPRAWHTRPLGIPVAGMPECLLNAEWQNQIDEVILVLPRADPARRQEIGELLKALPARLRAASAPAQSSQL